jgi:hypothetical protein
MWVRNILRDYIARLPLDFLFLPNNFNSSTATKSVGLHNIHVFIAVCFTFLSELAEVIRE